VKPRGRLRRKQEPDSESSNQAESETQLLQLINEKAIPEFDEYLTQAIENS
jgi:hypothetical protein